MFEIMACQEEMVTQMMVEAKTVMPGGLAVNLNSSFVMNRAERVVVYKLMESQNLKINTIGEQFEEDKFMLMQVKVMGLMLRFQQEPDLCRGGDKSLRFKMRPGQWVGVMMVQMETTV
jgi:hypothetical protein